jgi:hypothetical protein
MSNVFLLFPTGSIVLFVYLSVFSIPLVSEFVTAVYAELSIINRCPSADKLP